MAWLNRVSLGNFPDLAGVVNNLSESVKNFEKNLGLEDIQNESQQGLWPSPDGFTVYESAKNNEKREDAGDKAVVQGDANSSMPSISDEASTKSSMESQFESPKEIDSSPKQQDEAHAAMVQNDQTNSPRLQEEPISPFSQLNEIESAPKDTTVDENLHSSEDVQEDRSSQEVPKIVEDKKSEHEELNHAEANPSQRDSGGEASQLYQVSEARGAVEDAETEAKPEGKDVEEVSLPMEIPFHAADNDESVTEQNLSSVHTVGRGSINISMASIDSTDDKAVNANQSDEPHVITHAVENQAAFSFPNVAEKQVTLDSEGAGAVSKGTVVEQHYPDSLASQTLNLPSVSDSSTLSEHIEDLSEVNKLKEELKSMEAALQGAARQSQAKADEISRLLIENEHLKSTIEDLKNKSPDAEAEALRDEYQQRLGVLERKVYSLTKERDALRRENSRKSDTTALLKEKDEIIKQVMAEGEELSKKQAAQEAQMRKLRAQIRSLEEEKQRLISKLQVEEAKVESIKKDKAATEKALQEAVENSQAELAAQKEFYTNALNEAKDAQAVAEARANSEAKTELESRLREAAEREAALINALEELRGTLSNTEHQAASREDALRNEIDHLQKRCQATEIRYEEVVMNVPESTQPLMRQIKAMQESAEMRAEAWSGVERVLNARLQEAEAKATAAEEREKVMNERLSQTLSRMAVLEAQVSCLRAEQAQLTRTLEKERQRASENRQEYLAALETAASQEGRAKQLEEEIAELRNQHKRELIEEVTKRELIEQELEHERIAKLDLEKRFNNEIWRPSDKNATSKNTNSLLEHGPTYNLRRFSSATSIGSMEESFYLQSSLESPTDHNIGDRKGMNDVKGSNYSGRSIVPTTLEHLESSLRKKDGELALYMARLASLESIRDSLADELVKMTNECEKLRLEVAAIPGLKAELEALRGRHASALELMGERDEELEELRADLADVKEMYREQVEMLVSQIEKLSSSLSSK
eukprot:TRINITY_DN1642_c0_g2_i1.p1 TRINITY_DN1642_c0_g2~~TRINITY_DN1642_c0_g2_i1.p1  ORF type:complete len:993 (-),score=296.66 TRINITY_DN1642_c0_g2_i1:497-3475(-)